MKKRTKRQSHRKTTAVWISEIVQSDSHERLFARGQVKDVSSSGLLIHVIRKDILHPRLRTSLTLESLCKTTVSFSIEGLNTALEGEVTRTKSLGKSGFELAIDFTDDAPEYWRECLVDLLPGATGEFEEED